MDWGQSCHSSNHRILKNSILTCSSVVFPSEICEKAKAFRVKLTHLGRFCEAVSGFAALHMFFFISYVLFHQFPSPEKVSFLKKQAVMVEGSHCHLKWMCLRERCTFVPVQSWYLYVGSTECCLDYNAVRFGAAKHHCLLSFLSCCFQAECEQAAARRYGGGTPIHLMEWMCWASRRCSK